MDERWWEVFHDPKLSALTQRALTDNLDLKFSCFDCQFVRK
ncbi:hypothetical protein [Pseudomonas sp. LB3P58]